MKTIVINAAIVQSTTGTQTHFAGLLRTELRRSI